MSKNALLKTIATDQAAGLRSLHTLSHGSSAPNGPRFLAVARVPWSNHEHLADDLAASMARLGKRVLIVVPPERAVQAMQRAQVRVETLQDDTAPGTVARLVARGPGPNGSGLRAYVRQLSHRFDTVLVDLGTAPDDIDLLGLLPRDELVFLAEADTAVLFRTYALIKDLCVRRRLKTLHLVVGDANEESSARELHRALSAVAKSFINVDIRFAGSLPRLEAWNPPAGSSDAAPPERRMPRVPALERIAMRLMDESNAATASWGGGKG